MFGIWLAIVLLLGASMAEAEDGVNINKLWNFQDTKATRQRFNDLRLEVLTQIARTHGLEGNFDEAHALLDRVEKELETAAKVVKVRYLLERGRAFNSSKKVESALPLFEQAWDLAREIKEHSYAVDAAHMMGIAAKDPKDKMAWNLKAVDYAEKSQDERALRWLGTLYNNIGWEYHDGKDYEKALDMHQRCLDWYKKRAPDTPGHHIARWSVAKQQRMLKRYDEALKTQKELEALYEKLGKKDGFVQEEIGEILLAQGKAYFKRAYEILKDTWVAEEKERIGRLKKLAGD